MSNNNHTRRSYSSRGSSHGHINNNVDDNDDNHARRSSRSINSRSSGSEQTHPRNGRRPYDNNSSSSAHSVRSSDSGRFSETKLGQLLAKEGFQPPSDFEVPIMSSNNPKVNLVDRVAKRNGPPKSVIMVKNNPTASTTMKNGRQKQEFAQILNAEPKQVVMYKDRVMPVYPTTLGLNDNLEIEMDGGRGGKWMQIEDNGTSGIRHPTHDSGIILIHEDHRDAAPEAIIEFHHHHNDEPSVFDGDDLYITEFGAHASQQHHQYHDEDNFQDEYQDDSCRMNTTTTTSGSRDSVSTRSTRSIPWPSRPAEVADDPYMTRYRDNLMLGDEIEEFHALKREKFTFQKRRRSRLLLCILFVCNVLILAIVLPLLLLRKQDGDGIQTAETQSELGFTEEDMTDVPIVTTPTVPPHMATDSTFHSDWTNAGPGQNVMRDYVLHPIVKKKKAVVNTASIIAPHGKDIWLHIMSPSDTEECAGDPFQKVPRGNMVLVQVPMHDTKIVACTSDNHLVAAVHHIYVDAWKGKAHDYQLQVMDWNLSDYHKNEINHVFDFEQQHDTDRLYILFVLRPDSNKRVLFVDGPENVQQLYKSLTDFPHKSHNCDGTGMEYSKADAVWFTLAADTAAEEDEPGYILWDLTPMLSGNHVDSWSTLAWTCDETASTMLKPVVQVSVRNPDVVPADPMSSFDFESTTSPTLSPTGNPTANPSASDPSFHTDWSDTARKPVNEYVLHGVPTVDTIHDVTIALHPSIEMVFVLPQPEVVTLQGPCNPTGDWGAVDMPTGGLTVLLYLLSRDVQVVACSGGKVEASVTHVFIPSWTEEQEAHQVQVIDFNASRNTVGAHFEARPNELLYILMIPKAPYSEVLYVDGVDAVTELHDSLALHPKKQHQCDGTGHGFNSADAVWYADFETTVKADTAEPNKLPYLVWEVSDIIANADTDSGSWSTFAWFCDMEYGLMVKPFAEITANLVP